MPRLIEPPNMAGPPQYFGANAANAAGDGGADALLRTYRRLPVLERARFLRLLDEAEEEFNGEFLRRLEDAPLDAAGFRDWVAEHPEIGKDKRPTTRQPVANRRGNAGTIRGRRR